MCLGSGDAIMDRLELENKEDTEFKKQLEQVKWPIEYGIISIQLRAGKPTLVKVERTIKLD